MRRSERAAPADGDLFALIAGGGTGGHVIPAIAIGRALVAAGRRPEEIHFVGARRGMERDLVPADGFSITLLPGRGIARRLTTDNLRAVLGLMAAVVLAIGLVGRRRPRVIVSVGGFAAAPAVVAAWLWRVPLVVAEQNAVPGLVNRLGARIAAAAAVSFPDTGLPRSVLTGNPVRAEMTTIDRSDVARRAAKAELGLSEDDAVVLVSGGSLGAARLNRAAVDLAGEWGERGGLAIRHVVGTRDFDRICDEAPVAVPGGLVYQLVGFEDQMERCYAAADVAVQRAGASTVAELAAAGVPSILVPLPGAPGDHQTANARRLVSAGAAVLIADADLGAARLGAELDRLLGDPALLAKMGEAATTLARPRAADEVAVLAERCARR